MKSVALRNSPPIFVTKIGVRQKIDIVEDAMHALCALSEERAIATKKGLPEGNNTAKVVKSISVMWQRAIC